MNWSVYTTHLIGRYRCKLPNKGNKLACFDLDSTILKLNSDELYDPSIPDKLQIYYKKKYKIVIISNQKNKNPSLIQKRIDKLPSLIGVPFIFIASLKDDNFRKPRLGMWNLIDGDKLTSFYCGDAGGLSQRIIKKIKIKKDFSDTDLKFALNAGIRFIHRDEFIFNVQQKCDPKYVEFIYKDNPIFKPKHQELIIMVGYPASGKSNYVINTVVPEGYVRVNQDTLKTQAKCLKICRESLENGKSVVIDNTNPTKKTRSLYITIAQNLKIPIRCFHMTTSYEQSMHNNYYRNAISDNKVIPVIAYNIYRKRYQEPQLQEGFIEIVELYNHRSDDPIYNRYYY